MWKYWIFISGTFFTQDLNLNRPQYYSQSDLPPSEKQMKKNNLYFSFLILFINYLVKLWFYFLQPFLWNMRVDDFCEKVSQFLLCSRIKPSRPLRAGFTVVSLQQFLRRFNLQTLIRGSICNLYVYTQNKTLEIFKQYIQHSFETYTLLAWEPSVAQGSYSYSHRLPALWRFLLGN